MKQKYTRSALRSAKAVRRRQIAAEQELWGRLRNRALGGLKFRRQQPVGRFIVDFYCPERGVIIELDGAVHLGQEHKDMRRQRWLESEGFRVLRFKNTEVFLEMEVVLGEILRVCERRR